ncbi:16S rRNA (adenine(1518)-N(6)/adenine(1519)-N(6))-dimethyltransferase RsmA [Anaeromyxobacter diazotrophicus]|uniref:Ribosomal RNA small subunit methyltransferase A n=1 Tax=Anaeromyxobacter diazotrophicus TaxID=2590199 RepID=A0A7I9VKD5_9BACT|nr:16S rRNA (adenine(1518)-N(6)/adenine(1519)-N(6))-dimethyltransferase RsmA [Anaeromyxobacter diazotrophicus]GEJ56851.1 ribosomal RNA small subunit methyltransferase A [Anaeromyxobacter diazotrophicus]
MSAGYPSPAALLHKYGLRAKKSWGQNFLGDEAILDDIARLAVEAPGERVVELGAGLGHLTARLLARGAEVIAVERDRDMAAVLRGELGERIRLLEADAVKLDYRALHGGGKLAVVGNLPYHLTSPILFALLDQPEAVSRAVFLVQREVAERLAAGPGGKQWGLLSVLLQHRAAVTLERRVPRGAFLPPPEVESAVVRIAFGPPRAPVTDPARFRRLVKAGFAQRRKVLANALASARLAPPDALAAALAGAGIDGRRRGETLTVEEWAALERALGPAGAS